MEKTKAGYIALLGRPNAGKSALSNCLLQARICMVSHKQNATRKRSLNIVNQDNVQMIFVDTPGLHEREKLINQFMLSEAIKAMGDCDLAVFLSPVNDDLKHYEAFLDRIGSKPHIVLLTKKDLYTHAQILEKLAQFQAYQDRFLAVVPFSVKHPKDKQVFFEVIAKHLPYAPFYFEEDILTTTSTRDICAGLILEAVFEKVSDEIPYETDVQVESFKEKKTKGQDMVYIQANIIVEKSSQKIVFVGRGGETIKRIGKYARAQIEPFLGCKVFLDLMVIVRKGWSKDKQSLKNQGYSFD